MYPSIAEEWHEFLNGDLTPSQVRPFSRKRVWWRCKLGHEWQATVSDRVSNCACPYCSNHKVLVGFNDLLSQNPLLAKEWNYEKNKNLTNKRGEDISSPDRVTSHSNQKVWWKCAEGHEWLASICSRSRGNMCLECYKIRRKSHSVNVQKE